MKKNSLILFVMFLATVFSSKSNWIELPGYAPTATMNSVDIADTNCFVTVGVAGLIKVTYDGGNTWSNHIMPEAQTLNFVKCLSDSIFICCGNDGVIYRTLNKGTDWEKIESNSNDTLKQIGFFKTSFGVILGNSSNFLITNDGGASWKKVSAGVTSKLNWVDVQNDSTAVIVGDTGLILRTTNSGQNWNKLISPTKNNFRRVQILANGKICIGADSLILLNSQDNGNSWNRTIIEPHYDSIGFRHPQFICCQFFGDDSGYIRVFDDYEAIWYEFVTTDGGISWYGTDLHISKFNSDSVGFDINFIKYQTLDFGIGIGNGTTYKIIGYFNMNGVQRKYLNLFNEYGTSCDGIEALTDNDIAMIGDAGNAQEDLFLSNDGGINWQRTQIPFFSINYGLPNLIDICYPSHDLIIITMANETEKIVGQSYYFYYEYYLLKSTDQGQTFSIIRDSAGGGLEGPVMLNKNYGFLPSGNDSITYTNDGWTTFQKIPLPDDTSSTAFSQISSPEPGVFIEERINYKTYEYYFKKTENLGKDWIRFDNDIYKEMRQFVFTDRNNGCAYGAIIDSINNQPNYHLWLARTTDGGNTWQKTYTLDTNQNGAHFFKKLIMSDSLNGVTATDDGYFFYTHDGGKTWQIDKITQLASDEDIFQFTFLKPDFTFASGSFGKMFKHISKFTTDVRLITNQENTGLFISPNPASDFIDISGFALNIPTMNNTGKINIFNSLGKIVESIDAGISASYHINISKLQPGLYYLKINNQFVKFIKI